MSSSPINNDHFVFEEDAIMTPTATENRDPIPDDWSDDEPAAKPKSKDTTVKSKPKAPKEESESEVEDDGDVDASPEKVEEEIVEEEEEEEEAPAAPAEKEEEVAEDEEEEEEEEAPKKPISTNEEFIAEKIKKAAELVDAPQEKIEKMAAFVKAKKEASKPKTEAVPEEEEKKPKKKGGFPPKKAADPDAPKKTVAINEENLEHIMAVVDAAAMTFVNGNFPTGTREHKESINNYRKEVMAMIGKLFNERFEGLTKVKYSRDTVLPSLVDLVANPLGDKSILDAAGDVFAINASAIVGSRINKRFLKYGGIVTLIGEFVLRMPGIAENARVQYRGLGPQLIALHTGIEYIKIYYEVLEKLDALEEYSRAPVSKEDKAITGIANLYNNRGSTSIVATVRDNANVVSINASLMEFMRNDDLPKAKKLAVRSLSSALNAVLERQITLAEALSSVDTNLLPASIRGVIQKILEDAEAEEAEPMETDEEDGKDIVHIGSTWETAQEAIEARNAKILAENKERQKALATAKSKIAALKGGAKTAAKPKADAPAKTKKTTVAKPKAAPAAKPKAKAVKETKKAPAKPKATKKKAPVADEDVPVPVRRVKRTAAPVVEEEEEEEEEYVLKSEDEEDGDDDVVVEEEEEEVVEAPKSKKTKRSVEVVEVEVPAKKRRIAVPSESYDE